MNAQQELQTANGGELAQREDVDPILVMIQQAARDPDADVDKMERLFQLFERQEAKRAEAEFNAAMSAVQKETGRISADATNPQTRSKYASYAALDRVLRPIYTGHGLSLSFDEGEPCDGAVEVLCYVSHEAGHTRTYKKRVPLSDKGIKGNQMMTPTHANASGDSYGMRYLVKKIFNVAIGEDDDDGNAGSVELIDQGQVADIESLLDELGDKVDRHAFSEYLRKSLKVPNGNIEKLPKSAYTTVIEMLSRKRKQ